LINCAIVAVDVKHPSAKREYSYLIPAKMILKIGDVVQVPFNNFKTSGVVTDIDCIDQLPGDYELKSIGKKEDESIFPELVELSRKLAEFYGAAIIDFLKLMLPPKVSCKKETVYFLMDRKDVPSDRAFNQKKVFNFLLDSKAVSVKEISSSINMSQASVRAALSALQSKGIVKKDFRTVRRKPLILSQDKVFRPKVLTPEQVRAINKINANLQRGKKTMLLYGVTGSGKTEVYLQVIETVLKQGEGVILLVPEISLTPQLLTIFQDRFPGKIAVLHSRLSPGERYDEWKRIEAGEAKIVIGARSAIFSPVKELGLIIIDEEHESTFKQGEFPYYDGRMVAKMRARHQDAMLLLGSATPSVESYYKVAQGEYLLATLKKRVRERALPEIEIIDMREELKSHHRHIFSRKLIQGMKEAISQGKQIILFLNRRGHSTFVICRNCGFTLRCNHCDISLTYHFKEKVAKCHYCGFAVPAPKICPKCQSKNIRYFGAGTEKIEQEVKRLFPGVSTLRIDSDTTSRKGSLERMLSKFRRGKAQVMVGTQAVAKGLDFPKVTLVGIISADTSINMPDFRAGERTFQLITQVAGRAGRGDVPGKVYVQTYTPESFAIRSACEHNFSGFYKDELMNRLGANYPPFVELLNIVFTGAAEEQLINETSKLKDYLSAEFSNKIEVFGPVPAPRSRIKDNFRYHILLKSKDLDILVKIGNYLKDYPKNRRVNMTWDLAPQDLL